MYFCKSAQIDVIVQFPSDGGNFFWGPFTHSDYTKYFHISDLTIIMLTTCISKVVPLMHRIHMHCFDLHPVFSYNVFTRVMFSVFRVPLMAY